VSGLAKSDDDTDIVRMDQAIEPVRLARPVEKRRRISVAVILALSFGSLVFLSVGGVLALSVGANYRNTFDLLGARSTLLIEAMEDSLRGHMGRAEDAVDGIGRLYATGAFDIDDSDAMRAALSGTLSATPGASGLLIYTPDMVYRGVVRGAGGEWSTLKALPPAQVTAPDVLAALQVRKQSEGRVWGPFVSVDGNTYANVSRPLARDGVLRGWVIAPVELASLSQITRALSERYQTHAFILHDGKTVLADQRLAVHADKAGDAPALPSLAAFGDPILAAYPERKPLRDFTSAAAQSVEISEITLGDAAAGSGESDFIAMTKTVHGYSPAAWTIGAYYAQSDVGDEIRRAWLSAALGVLALLCAVAAAILLGKRLARPVRTIAGHAQRVAEFDLDTVSPLPRSRVLEFDDQATAFNAMLVGLRAFSTYIPRSLVARLVRTGEANVAEPREAIVTVMFTDIAGFTTLSENLPAAKAAKILNHHLALLCEEVDRQGGTVDKFVGDGMMAFFGAPDRLKGHAAAAVRAAAGIRAALHADNVAATAEDRPALRVRIGIHTGPVIVGNLGASDRVNYTIVGDTVNISQRLQELGKLVAPDAETVIVISGETASRLDERFETKPAGEHRLRGRGEATAVYVVGEVEDTHIVDEARRGAA